MTDTFAPTNFDPVQGLTVASSVPGVDANTAAAVVKSSASNEQVLGQIKSIAHAGRMLQVYDLWTGLQPSAQASAWQGFNDEQRNALVAFGAKAPNLDLSHTGGGGQSGGWWSDITGGIGHVASDIAGGVSRGFNDALSALGKPLGAVGHAWRTVVYKANMDDLRAGDTTAGQGGLWGLITQHGAGLSALWSGSSWASAWDATTNGNNVILPTVRRQLISQYGPTMMNLAMRVNDSGANNIVMSAPASKRPALSAQIQDPKFQELLQSIGNARMTFGQTIVGYHALQNNPDLHNVSGGLDAMFDFVMDPLRLGGKAASTIRAGMYGVTGEDTARALAGDASKMEQIVNGTGIAARAFDRLAQKVGGYLAEGRAGELGKIDPIWEKAAPSLVNAGVHDATSFKQWALDQAGLTAMLTGDAAKKSHGLTIVPHLTPFGWLKVGVKEHLQNALNKMADGTIDAPADSPDIADQVAGQGDPIASAVAPRVKTLSDLWNSAKVAGGTGKIPLLSQVSKSLRGMTTLIPDKNYLDIGDKTFDLTNFRRMAQSILPAAHADDAANVFAAASVGERRTMVEALTRQGFHAAGLMNTPESRKAAEDFLNGQSEWARHETYGPNLYDHITNQEGLTHPSALVEGQRASLMAIPTAATMRRIAQEQSMLTHLGINPMVAADRFMYLWRGFVLDRPGFAIRFAGDEMAARWLRSSTKDMIAGYLAQGAAVTRSDASIADEVATQLDRTVQLNAQMEKLTSRLSQLRNPEPIARQQEKIDALQEQLKTALVPEKAEEYASYLRAKAVKPIMPFHPIDRTLSVLASHGPEGLRPHINTVAKLYGSITGTAAYKWRMAERKVLSMGIFKDQSEAINAATHLYTHQPLLESFNEKMSAAHGDPSYNWSPEAQVHMLEQGAQGVVATMKSSGSYSTATAGDQLYLPKWQVGLDHYANSQLGQAVLSNINRPFSTQEAAVGRLLNDPELRGEWEKFERWNVLHDGRTVGVDATRQEAVEDWARQLRLSINAMVRTGNPESVAESRVLQNVVEHMVNTRRAPTLDTLQEHIVAGRTPQHVFGPDLLPLHKHEQFLSKSFEQLVGRPANWLARQPHFIQLYSTALKDMRPFAEKVANVGEEGLSDEERVARQANAEKLLSDMATRSAFNEAIPYIHNPALRTQFESRHRILFPFLFAQRQFLQRWGRTFMDSPDAIRKLQLVHNGLLTSGFLHTDQNGNEFYYYPGSQYVTELVTSVLNTFGIKSSIPMMVPFTGEVKTTLPGLANPVTPSVGPFAAVSLKGLSRIMPELNQASTTVLGAGAATPMWQQFTPSLFNRTWNALGPEQAGSELASTVMQAIKYLDATGHGLPSDANANDKEVYLARITNWARSLLMVRAALGFVLPSTPTPNFDVAGLDGRLQQLLGQMPYDEAITEYVKEHPDATAYTVAESNNATDGATPATTASLNWLTNNLAFAKAHPSAAAWFAPRNGDGFNSAAYNEQLALGMRTPKDAPTFLDDVIMSRASKTYYTMLDTFEKGYTALQGNSTGRQTLTNWWYNWKEGFELQNPTFADYLNSSVGHRKRLDTIADTEAALVDPNVPNVPQKPQLNMLLVAYQEFQQAYSQWQGKHTQQATDTKSQLKTALTNWGNAYTKTNPDVADFWTTVIRPEIETATG